MTVSSPINASTAPHLPLTAASSASLLERDVAAILEIAIELRPLADLLLKPLDEPGQGMVVRLLTFLSAVSEELKLAQAQRLDLLAWKAEQEAGTGALAAAVNDLTRTCERQAQMIEDLHALLLSSAD